MFISWRPPSYFARIHVLSKGQPLTMKTLGARCLLARWNDCIRRYCWCKLYNSRLLCCHWQPSTFSQNWTWPLEIWARDINRSVVSRARLFPGNCSPTLPLSQHKQCWLRGGVGAQFPRNVWLLLWEEPWPDFSSTGKWRLLFLYKRPRDTMSENNCRGQWRCNSTGHMYDIKRLAWLCCWHS